MSRRWWIVKNSVNFEELSIENKMPRPVTIQDSTEKIRLQRKNILRSVKMHQRPTSWFKWTELDLDERRGNSFDFIVWKFYNVSIETSGLIIGWHCGGAVETVSWFISSPTMKLKRFITTMSSFIVVVMRWPLSFRLPAIIPWIFVCFLDRESTQ